MVLAIAGLIFLVVFIAWPALQNSQKDTALRQDTGRIASALESIMVDNQGELDTHLVSSTIQNYAGKLSVINNIRVLPWWSNKANNMLNHSTAVVYDNASCPLHLGSSNQNTNPIFGFSNSSPIINGAAVVVWLNSGALYCVGV